MPKLPDIPYDSSAIWRIAHALAEGDSRPVDKLVKRLKSISLESTWNPAPEALEDRRHAFLYDWWESKRGTAKGPPPEAVNPFDLRPALGKVVVLDALDGGEDFYYRLYGSAVIGEPGKDLTGQRLTEIWTPLRQYFMATYRAVVLRPEPLFTRHIPHHTLTTTQWDRLILPLCDGDKVERLLVGLIAVPLE